MRYRLLVTLCVLGVLAGGLFFFGYLVGTRHVFPYPLLQKVERAAAAAVDKLRTGNGDLPAGPTTQQLY